MRGRAGMSDKLSDKDDGCIPRGILCIVNSGPAIISGTRENRLAISRGGGNWSTESPAPHIHDTPNYERFAPRVFLTSHLFSPLAFPLRGRRPWIVRGGRNTMDHSEGGAQESDADERRLKRAEETSRFRTSAVNCATNSMINSALCHFQALNVCKAIPS